VFVSGNYAYVADATSGVQIIDVSDPSSPYIASSCDASINAYSVEVFNNIAYVADGNLFLVTIDVSDPLNPQLLGTLESQYMNPYGIYVNGNTVYLTTWFSGLAVVDVSNPASPSLVSVVKEHDECATRCAAIKGDRLYTSDYRWNEICVYDIANAQNPVFMYRYQWNCGTYDFDTNESAFFAVDGYRGFQILNLDTLEAQEHLDPIPSNSLRACPNPFNPGTSVSFSLKQAGRAQLVVYNVRGQRVRKLLSESLPSGEHTVAWNGRDDAGHPVASGVYLVRLQAAGRSVTRKIMVLK